MKRIGMAAALLCVGVPCAAADEQSTLPDWMAGCWETHDGDRWTDECWMPPRGGVMLGMGRSGMGGELREWEAMRISLAEPAGDAFAKMAFLAAPGGTGWTLFAWSSGDGPGVTFYNLAHDYPQRIRYWRDGDLLKAEISLADGTKAVDWTYRRMAD